MGIIEQNKIEEVELPLQLNISFQKVYVLFEKYAKEEYAKNLDSYLSIVQQDVTSGGGSYAK